MWRDARGRNIAARCPDCAGGGYERAVTYRAAARLPVISEVEYWPGVAEYARNFVGALQTPKNWLIIAADAGDGRTTQAVKLAGDVLERGYSALYCGAASLYQPTSAARRRDDFFEQRAADARNVSRPNGRVD